jgi:hypothetical protein
VARYDFFAPSTATMGNGCTQSNATHRSLENYVNEAGTIMMMTILIEPNTKTMTIFIKHFSIDPRRERQKLLLF